MFFKTRNLLMMLFVLLFTVAVGCGDDAKDDNNKQDLTDVRGDQDTGLVGDTDNEADVAEEVDTNPTPTCTELSPAIGSGTCDSLCQTGCTAGQACVTTPDSNTCTTAGPGGQGAVCDQTVGCQAGFICASTDANSPSTCMKYCSPGSANGPQCDTGTKCNVLIIPGEERLAVCAPLKNDTCTVYPNAGCPTDQQCYPNGEGGTQCVPFKKEAKAGDSCKFLNECNENQICGGNPGICADYCPTVGDDTGCEGDLKCAKLGDGIPFGACIAG